MQPVMLMRLRGALHCSAFSLFFLNGSTLLQKISNRKRAATKTSVPQSVPITTEASLLLHGIRYGYSCLLSRLFHAKLYWELESRIRVTVQGLEGLSVLC